MDHLHHHKSKAEFGFPEAGYNPEAFLHEWQARASRMLLAQEHIAKGMGAAIRAQLRYGQEVMANRMHGLYWDGLDASHASARMQHEMEQFTAMVKEISDEIRSGFEEAGEIMRSMAPAHAETMPSAAPPGAPQAASADPVTPPAESARTEARTEPFPGKPTVTAETEAARRPAARAAKKG